MSDTLSLENRIALVTGGGRGIGRAISHELARRGATVVVNDKSGESIVCGEIQEFGGKAGCFKADVSDFSDAQNLIKFTLDTYGDLHIMVNNAGIILNSPIIYTPEESINAIIDVNLKGCIYCCKYVVPHMARRNYGKIINISSGAGLYAEPNYTAYSASKYGVLGLTETLAAEVSHYYINVNAVCPGAVLTQMLRNALSLRFPGKDPDEEFQKRLDGQFFHREVTDKDIANTVMFLASEDARNITSQWIAVTAGKEKKQQAAKPYFILPPEGQEIE